MDWVFFLLDFKVSGWGLQIQSYAIAYLKLLLELSVNLGNLVYPTSNLSCSSFLFKIWVIPIYTPPNLSYFWNYPSDLHIFNCLDGEMKSQGESYFEIPKCTMLERNVLTKYHLSKPWGCISWDSIFVCRMQDNHYFCFVLNLLFWYLWLYALLLPRWNQAIHSVYNEVTKLFLQTDWSSFYHNHGRLLFCEYLL